MGEHVDHVAVPVPEKEPAHSPVFIVKFVDDLHPGIPCRRVRGVDIVDLDRCVHVDRTSAVFGDQADLGRRSSGEAKMAIQPWFMTVSMRVVRM